MQVVKVKLLLAELHPSIFVVQTFRPNGVEASVSMVKFEFFTTRSVILHFPPMKFIDECL